MEEQRHEANNSPRQTGEGQGVRLLDGKALAVQIKDEIAKLHLVSSSNLNICLAFCARSNERPALGLPPIPAEPQVESSK